MNKQRLFIIVFALFAFGGPGVFAVQNPSIRNPAGVTTTPQSYLGNSLVDTSNPIDTGGNQIVTGNVRRGMHFRGNVPYSSPSSFSSTLGSSSLNSFMRDSAGAEDFGSHRGSPAVSSASGTNYQPYHLPSATVTTMSPNRPGITTQANTSINNGSQYVSGSQTQQNQPAVSTWGTPSQTPTLWQLYNPGLAGAQSQYNTLSESRPITPSPRLDGQQQQGRFGQYPQNENETATSLQALQQRQTTSNATQNSRDYSLFTENRVTMPQTELPQRNLQQSPETINQWQQAPTVPQYGTSEPAPMVTTNQPVPTVTQRLMPTTSEFTAKGEQNTSSPYRRGNLEQSLPVNNNTAYQPYTVSQPTGTQQYQGQGNRIPNATQDLKTSEAIAQIQKQLDDLIRSIDSRLQNPTDYTSQYTTTVQDISVPRLPSEMAKPTSQNNPSPLTDLNQMSQEQIHARARRIMGPHTDYETFSQAKYTQLYRAAEGHLNIGRFHQAADAYTLAAIYNPDDPLCYAGRGHALFAAGEYISSALFLIRAIEIDPEYVNTQIDLVELLGDAQDLNKKIAELNKWLQKSNAPGLGFLLGYVYYREGRFNEAKKVMDVVSREMPQSRAAVALKMAVDFKLNTQQ